MSAGIVRLEPNLPRQQGAGLNGDETAGCKRRAHLTLGEPVGKCGAARNGPK